MTGPHIPDAAIDAYDDGEALASVTATRTLRGWPRRQAVIRAGLAAALPHLIEQWRCNNPDQRTPCARCPDLPPLADQEMLPHARQHHPETLTAPGPYRSTLCANGLCAVFPGRCRLVEKWSGAACDHDCHRAVAPTEPAEPLAPAADGATEVGATGPPVPVNLDADSLSAAVYALIFNGLTMALTADQWMHLGERERIAAAIYDELRNGGVEIRRAAKLAADRADQAERRAGGQP